MFYLGSHLGLELSCIQVSMIISGVRYFRLLIPPNYKYDSKKVLGVWTKEDIAVNMSGCDLRISMMVESVNNIIIMSQWRRQPGLSLSGFYPKISSFIANHAVQFTSGTTANGPCGTFISFQVFSLGVVQMMVVFWVFTPCSALGLFWHYRGMYFLHNRVNWIVKVDYKVTGWKKISQLEYSLKDSYELDIFSSIQSLQHTLESIHSLWRWQQHVPPEVRRNIPHNM